MEVFLKLWRTRRAQGERAEGWLYRTAVRAALNELRAEARRSRYERLLGRARSTPTPKKFTPQPRKKRGFARCWA